LTGIIITRNQIADVSPLIKTPSLSVLILTDNPVLLEDCAIVDKLQERGVDMMDWSRGTIPCCDE
jgi:hypothetical protein